MQGLTFKCLPFQKTCLTIAQKLIKKPCWTGPATVGVVKEGLWQGDIGTEAGEGLNC